MHCPKCADKMIFKNNSMYCERGNMLLTHTLYARASMPALSRKFRKSPCCNARKIRAGDSSARPAASA